MHNLIWLFFLFNCILPHWNLIHYSEAQQEIDTLTYSQIAAPLKKDNFWSIIYKGMQFKVALFWDTINITVLINAIFCVHSTVQGKH